MHERANITRGQHHLPQFLLKGFGSRSRKKEVFTWLFRKDGAVVEANVKGIAKARDFYGNPNQSDIEERLSGIEAGFAQLVRKLRIGEGLEDKRLICEFVASTQIRTANMRSGVSEAMETFIGEFAKALSAPKNQTLIANNAFNGVSEKIAAGELDGILNQLPAGQREQVLAMIMPKLKEQLGVWVDEATRGMVGMMPSLIEPATFKESQNKLLSTNLPPEPRVDRLLELDWSVILCDDSPSLILGDVGVVAGAGTGELMHVLRHDPELSSIYLPLSSNCLLLGSRPGLPVASAAELNIASAQLSREFFISAKREMDVDLHAQIGMKQVLIQEDEMKDIMEQSFEGLSKQTER
jgi:hypothetical protein